MIDTKQVWLMNVTNIEITKCITELRKFITFAPLTPIPIPWDIAKKYINSSIRICDHPESFLKNKPLNHLTIRDAGIGDLLLLEPCLRESKRQRGNNKNETIASRYPDVFFNNPFVAENIKMDAKEDLKNIKFNKYDCYDDLRNYSETCENREKIHRTDCYNQIFKLKINEIDKEPRLYFAKDERQNFLKKKEGFRYIGINFDASHYYRKYIKCEMAIDYLLNIDDTNIIVIIGSYDYIKYKNHKRVIDLQGKTTIRESINVVRDLDYLIAVDSGIMHVGLTLHVPTVCMFSIISPALRIQYYKGHYQIICGEKCKLYCGCHHMAICSKGSGDRKKDEKNNFEPPCMDIAPSIFWDKIKEMPLELNKRVFYADDISIVEAKQEIIKKPEIVNINKLGEKKLTMPIIVENESANLPRFIDLVMSHKSIGRVIAIDGGSKDNTCELLEKAGAEVYIHPYVKSYHMQQAIQREISFSYVTDGTPCIFFDIDECMNKDLYDYLPQLVENCPDYGLIARKTFNYYADINDESKRIKDWPDKQPRIYKWNKKYKFINGAHHNTINTPVPISLPLNMYIIHFEKENKNRDELEKQWATMMQGVKRIQG